MKNWNRRKKIRFSWKHIRDIILGILTIIVFIPGILLCTAGVLLDIFRMRYYGVICMSVYSVVLALYSVSVKKPQGAIASCILLLLCMRYFLLYS